MRYLAILITPFLLMSFVNDDEEILYKQGLKYVDQKNNLKTIEVFEKLIKIDSTNINYLSYASLGYGKRLSFLEDPENKTKFDRFYAKAKEYAKKALAINSNHAMANFVYALSIGQGIKRASNKEKIKMAKNLQIYAEKAIKLDPSLPGPYHIMGAWHRTVAGFSSFERGMMNTFMGGAPKGGTYEESVKMFKKAISLNPKYSAHYHELAMTYEAMGKIDFAIKFCKIAMEQPMDNEDNKNAYDKCKKMIEELKK